MGERETPAGLPAEPRDSNGECVRNGWGSKKGYMTLGGRVGNQAAQLLSPSLSGWSGSLGVRGVVRSLRHSNFVRKSSQARDLLFLLCLACAEHGKTPSREIARLRRLLFPVCNRGLPLPVGWQEAD